MLQICRQSIFAKLLTAYTLVSILTSLFWPVSAYSLTTGPTTPEVSQYQPISNTEIVDLTRGDFSYNIPLLDVEGFPVSIGYQAGITMDQEASMVGLGWNLNIGAVNRSLRGLPDDFKGDELEQSVNMKDDFTYSANPKSGVEIFGIVGGSYGVGVRYNNYEGYSFFKSLALNLSIPLSKYNKKDKAFNNSNALGLSLEKTTDSQYGVTIESGFGLNFEANSSQAWAGVGLNGSLRYNTFQGIYSLGLSRSVTGGPRIETVNKGGSGVSLGFDRNFFSPNTYTPFQDLSRVIIRAHNTLKIGVSFMPVFGNSSFSLSASRLFVEKKQQNNPAFGYFFSESTNDLNKAVFDFNREKDVPYIQGVTPNLPLTQSTYDIFSVSGPGVEGAFIPRRSDVGFVFDAESGIKSILAGGGADFGVGPSPTSITGVSFHIGANGSYGASFITNGDWSSQKNQNIRDKIRYKQPLANDNLYDVTYFASTSDVLVENDPLFANLGDYSAIRPNLTSNTLEGAVLESNLVKFNGSGNYLAGTINPSPASRQSRQVRTTGFFPLSAEIASQIGTNPSIENFQINSNFFQNNFSSVTRTSVNSYKKPHHISEIRVVNGGGATYVYGVPAYNLLKKEVRFSTSNLFQCAGPSPDYGLVDYSTQAQAQDNSLNNNKGRERFFNSKTTPAYVYSFHLTSVLSPDYIDADGTPGPSDGDLGTWTKLNYSLRNPEFQWRNPVQSNRAQFDESVRSRPDDDKANYAYGKKEVWLIHSIETKNLVAEFKYEPRSDAFGVIDENGGVGFSLDGQKQERLVKISLYSKKDRFENQAGATPIKEIHFVYDYSLCPGTPNSNAPGQGKLTLKAIHFTYGKSAKAAFSPYKFSYSTLNPSYDPGSVDRWGSYQQASCTLPNSEFPYTNPASANSNASAWNLVKIQLPSGGEIEVEYESDDYAFTQDRKSSEMVKVAGIGFDASGILPNNFLFNLDTQTGTYRSNNVVFLDIPKLKSSSLANKKAEILANHIGDDDFIYFKFFLKLLDNPNGWEYVSGYSEIDDYGFHSSVSTTIDRIWIKLKPIHIGDKKAKGGDKLINPIAKTGFNFIRLNLHDQLNSLLSPNSPTKPEDLISSMFTSSGKLKSGVIDWNLGYFVSLRNMGRGQEFMPSKSWIRLKSPNGFKKGGGHRVKSVVTKDAWNSMTGAYGLASSQKVYKQIFDYTTLDSLAYRDGLTTKAVKISSGVASYEPLFGGDEIPHRLPKVYEKQLVSAPSERYYIEYPIGETFFPSPMVTYAKVSVSTEVLANDQINQTGAGKEVHEFFTSRDFPVIVKDLDLKDSDPKEFVKKTNPIVDFFLPVDVKDFLTVSQGYSVITNDMNGRKKASWSYSSKGGAPISGMEYVYKTKGGVAGQSNELMNEGFKVIHPNGAISSNTRIGVDFDITNDFRESRTVDVNGSVFGNVELSAPIVIPVPFPWFSASENRFRSAVTTKVIRQTGILEKVITYENGFSTEAENLAYDAHTGQPLVVKTTNEFKDPIYMVTVPAHWGYSALGGVFFNTFAKADGVNVVTVNGISQFSYPSINGDAFFPGDELLVRNASNPATFQKAWVYSKTVGSPNTTVCFANEAGINVPPGQYNILVVKSGKRNMPTAAMATIATRVNPVSGTTLNIPSNSVLESTATTFSETRQVQSGKDGDPSVCTPDGLTYSKNPCQTYNPYVIGVKGYWYANKSYAFSGGRSVTASNNNLRADGVFVGYVPFWTYASGVWNPATSSSAWIAPEENTIVTPYGYALEKIDVLGINTSALYDFITGMPKAIVANAKYRKAAVEDFELLSTSNSLELREHIRFYTSTNPDPNERDYLVPSEKHSGKLSAEVRGGEYLAATVFRYEPIPACSTTAACGRYFLKPENIFPVFSPDEEEAMLISVWIKSDRFNVSGTPYFKNSPEYTGVFVEVIDESCTPVNVTELSRSPLIEGWQRLEVEFNGPGTAFEIRIKNGTGVTAYVDDFRIYPKDAQMRSFVYDPVSLRLVAEGDENNFMKFYQYSQDGQLSGVKVETEKGILTVQDAKENMPIKP